MSVQFVQTYASMSRTDSIVQTPPAEKAMPSMLVQVTHAGRYMKVQNATVCGTMIPRHASCKHTENVKWPQPQWHLFCRHPAKICNAQPHPIGPQRVSPISNERQMITIHLLWYGKYYMHHAMRQCVPSLQSSSSRSILCQTRHLYILVLVCRGIHFSLGKTMTGSKATWYYSASG